MARALDPDVEAAIREALADPSAGYVEIGKRLGRATRTIRDCAILWGLERDTRSILTDDQHEKIRRMLRADCWTYRQIAAGTGCSVPTVYKVAAALGIDRTDRMHTRLQRGD